MKSKDAVKFVSDSLGSYLTDNSFELVDTEFVKEGPNWYLRVYVDKDGGITIDDLEGISRVLEKLLDECDPIEHPYILEVSSPGLERPLKKDSDFEKYKGSLVDVKLYKPFETRKEFQGELVGLIDDAVIIIEDDREFRFSRQDISSCKLSLIL